VRYDLQAVCGDTVSVTVTVQREIDEEDSEEEKGETTVGKVICPRYGLEKTEAYWLVIGDSNSNALLSIKRISIGEKPSKVSTSTYIHTPSLPFILFFLFCPQLVIYPMPIFSRARYLSPSKTRPSSPPIFLFFRQSSSSQPLRTLATTKWCYISLVTVTWAAIRSMTSTSLCSQMRMMMRN
jgi:Sec63 Brl domain